MNVHTTNKWDKDFKFHVSSDLVLLLKNDIQRIVKVKSLSRARLFATPRIVACTKLLCPWDFQGKRPWDFQGQSPWDFQGKSTGVGCHFLLQGIFPTQGSNPGLLRCRQTLYRLSHQGISYCNEDGRSQMLQLRPSVVKYINILKCLKILKYLYQNGKIRPKLGKYLQLSYLVKDFYPKYSNF